MQAWIKGCTSTDLK